MSVTQNITLEVTLDEQRMPSSIKWHATDSGMSSPQEAKAFMVSLWDGQDRSALRMDLWTTKMMVDEMNDFYFQTLMSMADTYGRANGNPDLVEEMKQFAKNFYQKAQEKLNQEK